MQRSSVTYSLECPFLSPLALWSKVANKGTEQTVFSNLKAISSLIAFCLSAEWVGQERFVVLSAEVKLNYETKRKFNMQTQFSPTRQGRFWKHYYREKILLIGSMSKRRLWTVNTQKGINATHLIDYHSFFCLVSQLFIIIDKMLLPGSIYLTVAISIERYVTVCHPFYRLHFEFLNFKFNILIQILSISLKCHSLPPILQVATLNLNSNVKYN